MTEGIFELLKLAAVGLVAGLFSSHVANRDHRHRKYWELRVNAYQNAIEALSDLVYYYERHSAAAIEHRELDKEFENKLGQYWDQAFPKVRKFADSGAFLFSNEANAILREFMANETHVTYVELESELAKARICLNRLVDCSKIDLKLKRRWFL